MESSEIESSASIAKPHSAWSLPLRLGLASGMLGITLGVFLSVLRIQQGGDIFSLGEYSAPMIATSALGGISVLLSIVAVFQGEALKRPAKVFALGLLAIASPYLLAALALALVCAAVIAALAG